MAEREMGSLGEGEDVTALVQMVMREAYQEANEDLRAYAEKVRQLNRRKQALRSYLADLRGFKAVVLSAVRERGVDLCWANANNLALLAEMFDEFAQDRAVGEVEYELCVPDRVPPPAVKSLDSLEEEIARWEARLSGLGDDAQLANLDLQNMMQKQQQALQMLSNVSKAAHDTAMAVIRKIGG